MQTKAGGITLRNTMIKKLGSEEKWREFMRSKGAVGGKSGHNGGFGSQKIGKDGLTGKERARVAGAVGGTKSRRHKPS